MNIKKAVWKCWKHSWITLQSRSLSCWCALSLLTIRSFLHSSKMPSILVAFLLLILSSTHSKYKYYQYQGSQWKLFNQSVFPLTRFSTSKIIKRKEKKEPIYYKNLPITHQQCLLIYFQERISLTIIKFFPFLFLQSRENEWIIDRILLG